MREPREQLWQTGDDGGGLRLMQTVDPEEGEYPKLIDVPKVYTLKKLSTFSFSAGGLITTETSGDEQTALYGGPHFLEVGAVVATKRHTQSLAIVGVVSGALEFEVRGKLAEDLPHAASADMTVQQWSGSSWIDTEDTIEVYERTGLGVGNSLPVETICWARFNFELLKWVVRFAACEG